MNPNNSQYSPIFKAWNVIYPVFIYFVATNVFMALFTMLAVFLGADPQEQYMALQTAAVAVTIPMIARYYQKDKNEPTVFWAHMDLEFGKKTLVQKAAGGIFMFLAGAAAGIALNNLLMFTGIEEISEGYQQVNAQFFAGGVLFELLGACLLTPFLEELLYRGVVYGRLCDLMIPDQEEKTEKSRKRERRSRILAMALSALLFGATHMNLVQFVYASVLGFLFAWFMEKSGHFYGPLFAHMGANFMAVLRVETKLFSWMESTKASFYAATAAFAAAAVLLIAAIFFVLPRSTGESENQKRTERWKET